MSSCDFETANAFIVGSGMTWGRYRVLLDVAHPFVVVDFETTGLRAGRHDIIEVAAIRITPGLTTSPYYHRLIQRPRKLSQRIVELTGITDDLLRAEGQGAREVISGLIDFVGNDPIVSYNAPFDLAFLNAACSQHAIEVRKRSGHSCALALARREWRGLPSYRLADVATMLRLDMAGQHRALGDAKRAAEVYRIATALRIVRLNRI